MAENNNGVAFTVTSKKTMTYVPASDGTPKGKQSKPSSKPTTMKNVIAGKK